MRMLARSLLVLLALLILLGLAGFLWLRTTPYWAGITLFAEGKRVENFRNMDQVFPALPVARSGEIWALDSAPRPLPERYTFDGESRSVAEFLDATETTGLIVLQDGQIRHEAYRLGADSSSRFTSWSVAKSVLSALVGQAIHERAIASLDDRIDAYVPELAGTDYGAVTLRHAITMSSGIAFDEDYDSFGSDINQLFISLAAGAPLTGILAERPSERPAGTYNTYISSDSIALGLVLEAATGQSLADYAASRLWGPLGAEADAYWSTGREGRALPFCCFNATLRDYARFGQLFLQGGARSGVQIVPAEWVAASTRPEAPHLEPGDNPASFWTFGYGYHWWIPEDPRGDFLAIGIWGQFIYVDPARQTVIVKTSADPGFDDRDAETVALFRALAE